MKKLLLASTFFFVLTIAHGQTNVYHRFPDSSFWRVDMHCQYAQTNCNEYYYYNYYFGGDTILNGFVHKKIMKDSVILVGIGGPPCLLFPWASFTGYMGALKEDSINNKTCFILPNQSNDTLLYDYNLNVGDTLKGILTGSCKMTVTSIDSVLIGVKYRRRWNFITCNEGLGYIIQGIGSDNGLIESINSQGFCFSQLVCVKDSNVVLYNANSSAMGCYLISTGENIINPIRFFSIAPNPFSTQTILQTDKFLKDASLTVYNLYGHTVKQIENLSGQTIVFHRDNLPSGLYFFRLKEDNQIFVGKLIITDN